jgi:UDP-N-acetylglucosamine--N-acetylmuramyl-(pentapeptide) pyrophosphoryl-undecaprenol N-acetylglucosamine transferase
MIKVIISGGGTGGHVFPAIAIANAIKKIVPDAEILFIGALGKLEMEKVPAAGYLIKGLNIGGFQRRLTMKNLSFPFKVLSSMIRADQIIKHFDPDVVIGVGGYASGPTLRVAARKKIPTLIQEQNSYPGITNKILAKTATKICVAYEGMEHFFPEEKIILTGNPVRQDINLTQDKREEGLKLFGLRKDKKTVLVLGGSLGASTINSSITKCLDQNIMDKGLQFIWQTGKYYYDEICSAQNSKSHPDVRINAFIERMDLAYNAADIIISRAGAIAISELCIIGKPVILIPSPNVAEDHQTKNAMAVVQKNAAILIPDREAEENLFSIILGLTENEEKQNQLGKNIKSLAIPDAAERIARESLGIINEKSNKVI